MSSDFQRYLKSIYADYKDWQKYYVPTNAEGKLRLAEKALPTIDFMMVQTVKAERDRQQAESRSGEKEKIERFPVLEGLRKYADRHVLLVGRPGAGKSTALARLMLEEAALTPNPSPKAGRGEPERIPVLMELRYWHDSITQLILNALARHGLSLTPEQLEPVLAQALLLFDGVNELPSEVARSQLIAFRRDHPKVPMIFTTRDLSLGGDLGIEQKLEMQPLTEAQMLY